MRCCVVLRFWRNKYLITASSGSYSAKLVNRKQWDMPRWFYFPWGYFLCSRCLPLGLLGFFIRSVFHGPLWWSFLSTQTYQHSFTVPGEQFSSVQILWMIHHRLISSQIGVLNYFQAIPVCFRSLGHLFCCIWIVVCVELTLFPFWPCCYSIIGDLLSSYFSISDFPIRP